jgi:hypothetical protein
MEAGKAKIKPDRASELFASVLTSSYLASGTSSGSGGINAITMAPGRQGEYNTLYGMIKEIEEIVRKRESGKAREAQEENLTNLRCFRAVF